MASVDASQLPREGEELTVLVERGGVPTTHRVKAGRVEPSTLLLPRSAATRWPLDAQDRVTVMYQREGRLFLWPMQVEEVLPSSAWLVGTRGPSAQERRAFVRARVELAVALAPAGQPLGPAEVLSVDLSASGMALPWPHACEVGATIHAWLGEGIGDVQFEVVRAVAQEQGGVRLALRFSALPSVAQDRVTRLVMRHRERRLIERLERRRLAGG